MLRDPKIDKNCPCLFLTWSDSKNGWTHTPPAVDCSFWCDSCGWNPDEKKRRFSEGEFVTKPDGTRSLTFRNALVSDAVL